MQDLISSYKKNLLLSILLTFFVLLFLYGIFATNNYFTWFNFKTIIRDAALYGIMAIGLTFVTLSGNFFYYLLKKQQQFVVCLLRWACQPVMELSPGLEVFQSHS